MAVLKYQSDKFKCENHKYTLTFFTSTYNRKDTITRTYESLLSIIPPYYNGSKVTFEWIIVDDGSTDNTAELCRKWCDENRLPMRYYQQENQGKHVAMNFAIQQAACGEFWLTIDSDDTILPNALEIYFREWNNIGNDDGFCAVTARCKEENGNIVGNPLPHSPLDVSAIDLRLKYRIKGEMLEMYRVEILKQYPFPSYDPRMRFCPESIIWFEIAKKYKMRVVDEAARIYFHDTATSIMSAKNINRSAANYYLWLYHINNLSRYIIYNPVFILKAYVGISMDGFTSGRNVFSILKDCNSLLKKLLAALFMPIGLILSRR